MEMVVPRFAKWNRAILAAELPVAAPILPLRFVAIQTLKQEKVATMEIQPMGMDVLLSVLWNQDSPVQELPAAVLSAPLHRPPPFVEMAMWNQENLVMMQIQTTAMGVLPIVELKQVTPVMVPPALVIW